MTRGFKGNSKQHAKAGRLGGLKKGKKGLGAMSKEKADSIRAKRWPKDDTYRGTGTDSPSTVPRDEGIQVHGDSKQHLHAELEAKD